MSNSNEQENKHQNNFICHDEDLPNNQGTDISTLNNIDRQECKKKCNEDSDCNAFTWTKDGTNCFLKKKFDSSNVEWETENNNAEWISGSCSNGQTYEDDLIDGNIENPQSAQEKCENDSHKWDGVECSDEKSTTKNECEGNTIVDFCYDASGEINTLSNEIRQLNSDNGDFHKCF